MEHEISSPTIEADVAPIDSGHRVYLPVSEEIAKALQLGESAHVQFEGIVKEVSAGYNDSDDYSVSLNVQRVKIDTENEFEKMSREDDE